jgi:hypothetical protein
VDEDGKPLFSLGRWGIALNAIAVVYQATMAINLLWPRPFIYDLTGHTWWLRWSALLFVGIMLLIGAIYFGSRRLRSRIEPINVSHTAALMPVADAEAA